MIILLSLLTGKIFNLNQFFCRESKVPKATTARATTAKALGSALGPGGALGLPSPHKARQSLAGLPLVSGLPLVKERSSLIRIH